MGEDDKQPNEGLDALRARVDPVYRDLTIAGAPARIWHPRSPESLIDVDAFERDERLPYWADIWPSSFVLAECVGSLDGSGGRLLELGCGIGVVALAAARAGFAVTAT